MDKEVHDSMQILTYDERQTIQSEQMQRSRSNRQF